MFTKPSPPFLLFSSLPSNFLIPSSRFPQIHLFLSDPIVLSLPFFVPLSSLFSPSHSKRGSPLGPEDCQEGAKGFVELLLPQRDISQFSSLLLLCSVLLLCSFCAPSVLLLCSFCAPSVLLLCSFCAPSVLLLCSFCAPATNNPHFSQRGVCLLSFLLPPSGSQGAKSKLSSSASKTFLLKALSCGRKPKRAPKRKGKEEEKKRKRRGKEGGCNDERLRTHAGARKTSCNSPRPRRGNHLSQKKE